MQHHKLIYLGTFSYFGFVAFFSLRHNVWLSPDQFLVFALVVAVFLGRGKKFLADWLPFIIMFLGYEALRGINPEITKIPVNITNIIDAERFLFGGIPSVTLQSTFFHPGNLQWYDLGFAIVYMSHFIAFLPFAFYLWVKRHNLFVKFSYTILLLSYLAFITFILFPVAPPWMASEMGFIPKIWGILNSATAQLTIPGGLPSVYKFFGANKVAAVPSLHASYPLVIFLISLLLKKPLVTLISLIYMLLVWIAIVYLGEHYVVDILAGVIYTIFSFLIIKNLTSRKSLISESH